MKASFDTLLAQLPRDASEQWPAGEPFVRAMVHGTMSVEVFAPNELDRQTQHEQDEIYFVKRGTATLSISGEPLACTAGDAIFVAAGQPHQFTNFSKDFATWVVFWGPSGGEQ